MTLAQLIEAMPEDVHESFDPLAHNSPAELAWLCMHLLDLSDEGEIEIDRQKVKKFRDKCIAANRGNVPYIG